MIFLYIFLFHILFVLFLFRLTALYDTYYIKYNTINKKNSNKDELFFVNGKFDTFTLKLILIPVSGIIVLLYAGIMYIKYFTVYNYTIFIFGNYKIKIFGKYVSLRKPIIWLWSILVCNRNLNDDNNIRKY